ncbi:MAG: DUF2325 domain-containing protein [Clostridiales bacterium]|nr:DUF2325 domain-containing protein [Clostridiales bacterium]
MGIVIVGGDYFEKINGNLCKNGNHIIKHISGRKSSHNYAKLPQNADLVIVFTDFVNHRLSEHIKKETRKLGIKTIYSKRNWSSISSLVEVAN